MHSQFKASFDSLRHDEIEGDFCCAFPSNFNLRAVWFFSEAFKVVAITLFHKSSIPFAEIAGKNFFRIRLMWVIFIKYIRRSRFMRFSQWMSWRKSQTHFKKNSLFSWNVQQTSVAIKHFVQRQTRNQTIWCFFGNGYM